MVLRRACTMLGDREEAREVVQDIFMKLVERPGVFEGRSSITTWLYAVTTNACLARLRQRRTRSRLLSEHDGVRSSAAGAIGSGTGALAPDTLPVLRDVLRRLPPRLAEVAVYHYFDELTQAETAEVMGCSRRTVVTLLSELRHHPLACETQG